MLTRNSVDTVVWGLKAVALFMFKTLGGVYRKREGRYTRGVKTTARKDWGVVVYDVRGDDDDSQTGK